MSLWPQRPNHHRFAIRLMLAWLLFSAVPCRHVQCRAGDDVVASRRLDELLRRWSNDDRPESFQMKIASTQSQFKNQLPTEVFKRYVSTVRSDGGHWIHDYRPLDTEGAMEAIEIVNPDYAAKLLRIPGEKVGAQFSGTSASESLRHADRCTVGIVSFSHSCRSWTEGTV